MNVAYRISVNAEYLMRAQQVTRGPASRASSRHPPAAWLQWGTRLVLAALIVFLASLHDWPGAALVSVGLAGSFASQLLQRRSLRIARERATQTPGELLIAVDEQGITADNNDRQDRLTWSEFAGANDHPDGVLLSLKTRGGYWLPDTAIRDGTPAEVRGMLVRHLDPQA